MPPTGLTQAATSARARSTRSTLPACSPSGRSSRPRALNESWGGSVRLTGPGHPIPDSPDYPRFAADCKSVRPDYPGTPLGHLVLFVSVTAPATIEDVERRLRERRYIGDRALATSIFLALKLQKPLFIEGEAGVGKTQAAKVMADVLGARLIRPPGDEGLDLAHAG